LHSDLNHNPNFDAPVFINPLLTVEEVADLLRVPPSWVYANAKSIPGYLKLGRYVRFRKADVIGFLSGPSTGRVC
jgi:excisionase family DNA binding protein